MAVVHKGATLSNPFSHCHQPAQYGLLSDIVLGRQPRALDMASCSEQNLGRGGVGIQRFDHPWIDYDVRVVKHVEHLFRRLDRPFKQHMRLSLRSDVDGRVSDEEGILERRDMLQPLHSPPASLRAFLESGAVKTHRVKCRGQERIAALSRWHHCCARPLIRPVWRRVKNEEALVQFASVNLPCLDGRYVEHGVRLCVIESILLRKHAYHDWVRDHGQCVHCQDKAEKRAVWRESHNNRDAVRPRKSPECNQSAGREPNRGRRIPPHLLNHIVRRGLG